MNYQISKGYKAYPTTEVLNNIQFSIKGQQKIALVGRNGSGKTTLLRIIAGEEELDSGTIHRQKQTTIGYLAQTSFENENNTVEVELYKIFDHIKQLEEKLDQLTTLLSATPNDEKLLEKYSQLLEKFETSGGYNYEYELMSVFTKFGFSKEDLKREINTYSGGERTKLAFVKLLLSKPDILLLDEPTNHLDLETIVWLGEYLRHYPKALIIVSHDRLFLDEVVTETYELEFGVLTLYHGNYSSFVKEKAVRQAAQQNLYDNQQKEIERLETVIEKFRYKKDKAAFAQSKIKYLARMDKVEKPNSDTKNIKLALTTQLKGGERVLTIQDLAIGYDKVLFTISLEIRRQQRIGVIGPNGIGKSALVKTLVDQIPALGGSLLYGHQIEVGYFDQQLAQWNSNKSVIEELWSLYPDLDRTTVRGVLGRFLFSGDDVFKEVSALSGGEKVRLNFAKMMLQGANFLILDEPTNHLDILGKEVLEDALLDYKGTILFVSHDRYFINKIATSLVIIEEDGKVTYFDGNYQEYQRQTLEINEDAKKEVVKQPTKKVSKQSLKKIETSIKELEERLELLEQQQFLEENYNDYQKMQLLEEEIEDTHKQLEELLESWEEVL